MNKILTILTGITLAFVFAIGVTTAKAEAFQAQGPFWTGVTTYNFCWPADCSYDFKGYIQEYSDGHLTSANVFRHHSGGCVIIDAYTGIYNVYSGTFMGNGNEWPNIPCSSSWNSTKYNYGPNNLTYNYPYEAGIYASGPLGTYVGWFFTPRLYWK